MTFDAINFKKSCKREQVTRLSQIFLHANCRMNNFSTISICNFTRGIGETGKEP